MHEPPVLRPRATFRLQTVGVSDADSINTDSTPFNDSVYGFSDPEAGSNMTSYQETRTADPSRTDVAVSSSDTPEHLQLLNETSLSLGSSHTGSEDSAPATPFATGSFQLTGSFAPIADEHDNHKT